MTEASKQRLEELIKSIQQYCCCPGPTCSGCDKMAKKLIEAGFQAGMRDPDANAEKIGKLEAENKRLKEQIEFTKEYLNPADTSFRQMVNDFKSLSKDDQVKLIDLSRSLKALSSGGE